MLEQEKDAELDEGCGPVGSPIDDADVGRLGRATMGDHVDLPSTNASDA